jgi:hypothetical protein
MRYYTITRLANLGIQYGVHTDGGLAQQNLMDHVQKNLSRRTQSARLSNRLYSVSHGAERTCALYAVSVCRWLKALPH